MEKNREKPMSNLDKKRIAIFASGSGTNMENLAKHVKTGKLDCEIGLIVCDNPGAFALERATKMNLKTFIINRKEFQSKEQFDAAISEKLMAEKIDAVFLAGYMRILGSEFIRTWRWRILNIHPSLLPKFPGAHSIRDAHEAKVKETGVTVHFVDEGVDTGPVILQRTVPILPDDSLELLEERVHALEYEIYPEAAKLFLEGKLRLIGGIVEINKE